MSPFSIAGDSCWWCSARAHIWFIRWHRLTTHRRSTNDWNGHPTNSLRNGCPQIRASPRYQIRTELDLDLCLSWKGVSNANADQCVVYRLPEGFMNQILFCDHLLVKGQYYTMVSLIAVSVLMVASRLQLVFDSAPNMVWSRFRFWWLRGPIFHTN